MPNPNIPPEDIEWLKSQGIDPETVQVLPPDQMSGGRAALATLKGHAGGTLGGGAGALTGGYIGGELGALGGPAAPVTIPAGAIIGATIGALGGGYGGQKAQQAILPSDVESRLEQQAQEAQQAHPYISLGTDIASSALASGGAFSPSTLLKAGRGAIRPLVGGGLSAVDKTAMSQLGQEALSPEGLAKLPEITAQNRAMQNVAFQSLVNPAIMTGANYALTGQLPTGRELAGQAIGGALFAKPSRLGLLASRLSMEPQPEPLANGKTQVPENTTETPKVISPWLDKQAIDDGNIKQAFFKLPGNNSPRTKPSDMSDEDWYQLKTKQSVINKTPVDQMRQALHENFMRQQSIDQAVQQPLKMQKTPEDEAFLKAEQERVLNEKRKEDFLKAKQEIESHPADVAERPPTALPKEYQPVSENTLRITQDKLLPTDVARPVNQPNTEILPQTKETLPAGRTDAEIEQDRLEQTGAKYSQPTEQPLFTHNAIRILQNAAFHPRTSKSVMLNTIRNQLGENSSEWKMWKDLGIENAYVTNPESLMKWMITNGPKVEVRKFGEGNTDYAKAAKLQHELDTLGVQYNDQKVNSTDPKIIEKWNEYIRAKEDHLEGTKDAHWQSIAPKSEHDMPGYVEIAVVKPLTKPDKTADIPENRHPSFGGLTDAQRGVQFPSSHSFPPNTLGFVRGYMETLPSGEKVFHVIEVQKDTIVNNHDGTYRVAGHPEFGTKLTRSQADAFATKIEPLNAHSERLALKAAIDHARSEGATKIAISDAETAMMAEGHDRNAVQEHVYENRTNKAKATPENIAKAKELLQIRQWGTPDSGYVLRKLAAGRDVDVGYGLVKQDLEDLGITLEHPSNNPFETPKISQEPGMRLHYDRTLPKIAEELTGQKGQKVSFGEHKMALSDVHSPTASDEPFHFRKDLIFRNPDGTPKTDVSARVYDISHVSAKREQGEPFSMMGRKYSQPSSDADRYAMLSAQQRLLEQSGQHIQPNGTDFHPQYLKNWKEMEEIKNRQPGSGKGMPPVPVKSEPSETGKWVTPDDVVNHIWGGKATTGSVMGMLAAHTDHPFAPLAKVLYENMDAQSREVPWADTMKDRSEYRLPGTKPTADSVQMALLQSHSAPVVMEEALHSMTSAKLPKEWEGLRGSELHKAMTDYLSNGSNDSIKDLIKSYIQTAQHLGYHKALFENRLILPGREPLLKGVAGKPDLAAEQNIPYAMGDLHEFIAGAFKDTKFQETLNSLQSGLKDGRTMWQRVVDAVSKLLGIPVKYNSMLDRVLRSSAELISQERPTGKGIENAIQKSSTSGILSHPQEGIRSQGSERERMGQGNEGKETTEESRKTNLGTEQKNTGDEVRLQTKRLGWIGRTTESVINKISELNHPSAQKVSEAFHNVLNERQRLIGRWKNAIVKASEDNHLNQSDKEVLAKQFDKNRLDGKYTTELLTNGRQLKFYNTALAAIKDNLAYRTESKEPVIRKGFPTMPRAVEGYWPTTSNQRVAQDIRTGNNFDDIAKWRSDFIANRQRFGETPEEAEQSWNDYKTAMQGGMRNSQVANQQYFNASRREHGISLPESMTEKDPVRNLERYFSRQAIDNAHYRFVESNPEVMSALGEKRDAWNKPIEQNPAGSMASSNDVRTQLQEFQGRVGSPSEYNEEAVSSVATAIFIASPALEAHKIISNVVGLTADVDNPYQFVRVLSTAVKNINQGYQHAIEGGVTRMTARSSLDMLSGTATMAERMRALAQGIRHVSTLGDLTNRWGSALLQSAYEVIVPSKILRANSGEHLAQQWLKNLDPNYKVGKQYNEQEQHQLASIATNYVHGTADGRMLPAWMLKDSEISGFFTLAHWSVAQTNRFYSNILTPATHGNVVPLLNSLFGAAIGGYLVKEIRQEFQGRKNPIPSLKEIMASDRGLEGNMGLLGYNLVAAAQYSGFGGLLSQVAKYPFDFAFKQQPYGSAFPLDQVATDLGETLTHAATAIATDPNLNWLSLAEAVTAHTLTQTFQLGRQAYNNSINAGLITGLPAEKKLLTDKLQQLRRFDMVEGLFYNESEEGSNPYMNLEQKKFKMTQDIGKAVQMLPELVNNIIQTYGSQPDLMMSKLKALKQNQYATMPSIETMPISFMKYIVYLQKTEGPEAAQKELQDFMQHKVINTVKGALVP